MNKKADVEISGKTLIGLLIVIVIMIAFIGLFIKFWAIFLGNADEATLNSFDNLMYEIKSIKDGETKEVPYYIHPKYMLTTQLCQRTDQIKEDICICSIGDCQQNLIERDYAEPKTELIVEGSTTDSTSIRGDQIKGTKNVKISRTGNKITISET